MFTGLLLASALLAAPLAATAAPLTSDLTLDNQIADAIGAYRDSVAVTTTDGYVTLDAVQLSGSEIQELEEIANSIAGVHNVTVYVERLTDECTAG